MIVETQILFTGIGSFSEPGAFSECVNISLFIFMPSQGQSRKVDNSN